MFLKMSKYVPSNYELRTQLILLFHLKKSALESHRMLVEAYGEHALGRTQCNGWFNKFKSGDFDVRNEERGKPPKKFEDAQLQALLDEDGGQTQEKLAQQLDVDQSTIGRRLKAMGKTCKAGSRVPHEHAERKKRRKHPKKRVKFC
eukprot:TRINITY_DN23915_c0_g1_i1.p1 TRINITY_DN23915_c0_g1~~TRINITY_DN23915_c0_g1_i1.p1  ORF type:complete len:146 (-),score=2.82 TRINITY_DN23915_c0_g1_i1:208-645(-)